MRPSNNSGPLAVTLLSSLALLTSALQNPVVDPAQGGAKKLSLGPFSIINQNRCGPSFGRACSPLQEGGGWCCSGWSYCGNGPLFCGDGCQEGYGKCDRSSPENRPPQIFNCGSKHGGNKCAANDCCSPEGVCGQGELFCGVHCQQQYGRCDAAASSKTVTQQETSTTTPPKTIVPTQTDTNDQQPRIQSLAEGERCGPQQNNHTCSDGRCCSSAGYCGTGPEYCAVPQNCQHGFGWCDSAITPMGYDTICDKRKTHTHLPWGKYISHCKKHKTIALTFDDGPTDNTPQLLDLLHKHGAHATFFLTGVSNGKGEIDLSPKWIEIVKRMILDGHHIGSHTWSHRNLDKLSSKQRELEMIKNERAIANIIGKYPTFMRPPYIECHAITGCLKVMKDLGYHVAKYDVDSRDTENLSYNQLVTAIDKGFKSAEHQHKNVFFIQHDTNPASAFNLTSHILTKAKEHKWQVVTLADCLGAPEKELYRIPTWMNFGSVSPNSCLMSGPGLCAGVGVPQFNTREECFSSARTCFTQVDVCKPQQKKNKHICHGLKDFCETQVVFCGECDKPNHPNCTSKDFWYRPQQNHGTYV